MSKRMSENSLTVSVLKGTISRLKKMSLYEFWEWRKLNSK